MLALNSLDTKQINSLMLFCRYYLTSLFLTFTGLLCSQSALAQSQPIKQALLLFDQENYTEAQAIIDQASQDAQLQHQASTWYYRGVIYEQLMRKNIALDVAPEYLEEAFQSYQKTLTLTPDANQYHSFAEINIKGLWAYYLNRGSRYYKAEVFDQAIEQFEISKRLDPQDPYTRLYTAITAHQAEQFDLALEQYHSYLQLAKGNPAVYRGLANLTAYHLQDLAQANQILEQAIQQYPWEVCLLEEQNTLLLKQDQLAKTPKDPLGYFQLGHLYEQTDKPSEAAIYYQKAAALAPIKLEPICRLGIVNYNQAASIINNAAEMPEEEFQEIGEELKAKADQYLREALYSFKQARKLKRSDLFIIKQLHIIYTRLNMPDKVKVIEATMKRMKGGPALLATLS
jgi:tetratricopeptide (TPR) repeat protein